MSLPYYFEVPEIELPFDVMNYVDKDESGNEHLNFMMGYDSHRADMSNTSKPTGMTEQTNIEMSKLIREWAKDTFTIKTTSVSFLRTLPGQNGWWHCEGPVFHTRQCALNFPVFGDFEKSEAQWATFPRFKNIDPRENEKHGFVTQTDMKETEMLCRWTNQTVPGFQNTMIMNRIIIHLVGIGI